jgi:hypothetical protein
LESEEDSESEGELTQEGGPISLPPHHQFWHQNNPDFQAFLHTLSNNGRHLFPFDPATMYPDYEEDDDDDEDEEEEDDDENGMETGNNSSNNLVDYENISSVMLPTHPQQTLPLTAGITSEGGLAAHPRQAGEGFLDWKNSLNLSRLMHPSTSSSDQQQSPIDMSLTSPYLRFVKNYPQNAMKAFYYDSDGELEMDVDGEREAKEDEDDDEEEEDEDYNEEEEEDEEDPEDLDSDEEENGTKSNAESDKQQHVGDHKDPENIGKAEK